MTPDFHDHLDVCSQCRDHPMNLCANGVRILHSAVLGSTETPQERCTPGRLHFSRYGDTRCECGEQRTYPAYPASPETPQEDAAPPAEIAKLVEAALSIRWQSTRCGGCGITYSRCLNCSVGVQVMRETNQGQCGGHQNTPCDQYCIARAAIEAVAALQPSSALSEIERLKAAVLWALGENGTFSEEPPPLAGKWRRRFWWRGELRERAFGAIQQPPSLLAAPEVRVRAVITKIREAAADSRAHASVPCQTDETWHADEYESWADELEAAFASLAATNGRLRSQIEALRREHYACDDSWYACPMTSEYSEDRTRCTCGAEEHNRRVDAILAALAPLAEPPA